MIKVKKIIFTLFGFVMFWAVVTDAWGYSGYIFKNDINHVGKYIYGYFSRCIWVMPAIFLINKYSDKLELHKYELYRQPKFDKPLIIVITISLSYVAIGMIVSWVLLKRLFSEVGDIIH